MSQLLPYPPDTGAKIRCFNVIRYLSQAHSVTLVAFARTKEVLACKSELEKYCRHVEIVHLERSRKSDIIYFLRSLISSTPFSIFRDYRDEFADVVKSRMSLSDFDFVHVDQLNMAQYAHLAVGAVKVLDAHNVVHRLYEGMYEKTSYIKPRKIPLYFECLKMRRHEAGVCAAMDAVIAVTESDRDLLKALAPTQRNILTVPIAIDLDDHEFGIRHRLDPKENPAKKALFVGALNYVPNDDGLQWFCREVSPLVKQKVPDFQVLVVGRGASHRIRRLANRSEIKLLGYAENLEKLIKDCAVSIIPLRLGSGMRVKILSSLAAGVPVVSTSLGSEGIGVTNGKNILIADSALDFSEALVKVLEDHQYAQALAANGFELVRKRYAWQVIYRLLDEVYASAWPVGSIPIPISRPAR